MCAVNKGRMEGKATIYGGRLPTVFPHCNVYAAKPYAMRESGREERTEG